MKRRRTINWLRVILGIETGLLLLFLVFSIWFYAVIWSPLQESAAHGRHVRDVLEEKQSQFGGDAFQQ